MNGMKRQSVRLTRPLPLYAAKNHDGTHDLQLFGDRPEEREHHTVTASVLEAGGKRDRDQAGWLGLSRMIGGLSIGRSLTDSNISAFIPPTKGNGLLNHLLAFSKPQQYARINHLY